MVRKIQLLLLLVIFFIFPSPAEAKDFSSFYKTTYLFSQGGLANVTQEISLINETADYFVTEYTLSLVGGSVSKVEAYDQIGPLTKTLEVKDQTTIISLKLNEKAVGRGKVLSFILKYQVSGLAKKEGNLWRISIPKLANASQVDDYQLILKIPDSFGILAYLSPTPEGRSREGGYFLLSFKKESLLDYGIAATFGQHQNFNFRLLYDLQNETLTKKGYEIALVPDTDYQSVYYSSISPEPESVAIDEDGNFLATFVLSPEQKLNIQAEGTVKVFSQKNSQNPTFFSEDYLSPQKYWPVNDVKIKELAERLKTPKNIYNYVVSALSYDYDSVSQKSSRKGALFALENRDKSLCSEFTDLFVALCRAAGIPARELEGFAYTDNPKLKGVSPQTDLLHSWPEYFDKEKKEWVMVDPTWGSTSGGQDYFNRFDMTHIVFAIHGKSDSSPYPAGSYKNDDSSKQVFISFGETVQTENSNGLEIKKVNPAKIYTRADSLIELTVKNLTGQTITGNDIEVSGGLIVSPLIKVPDKIPPYGLFKLLVLASPKDTFSDYPLSFSVIYKGESSTFSLIAKSLSLRYTLFLISLAILIVVFTLYFLRKIRKNKNEVKLNQV